ncbi:MAG: hypothetical protein ABIO40_08915 [Devosia sp.]
MPEIAQSALFAHTPDGTRLPVIDLTNPIFAVPQSDAELNALAATALAQETRRGPVQRFFIRMALKLAARRSRLVAALQAANDGFLSGIATYVMKLGPDNLLPPFDTPIDKGMLRSPIVASLRIRLQQVATLLAEAVAPKLAADPQKPLCLLEIAGGPSSDALNALLLLEQRGLLAGRKVRIEIYDLDSEGPAFAASMLEALKAAPLAGRDILCHHSTGNWSDTAGLRGLLNSIPSDAIVAATSEGGLFEYGSDADISGVLRELAPRVDIVTGSVTRNDQLNRLLRLHSPSTVPRGLDRFAALIGPSGYRIARSRPCPLSDQVLLTRS